MFRCSLLTILLALVPLAFAAALPVSLGEVEIGLESYDGYQEGMAYFSTDEEGTSLEILISYRGFGLDTVKWTFSDADVASFQDAAARAAWWRSRLLEMTVDQRVEQEITPLAPAVEYSYRGTVFPFESSENVLRFVRQGRDYAMLLAERVPGADTRRSGEKTLPVFTMHFSGKWLPALRDMLAAENLAQVLADYADEKAAIQEILTSGP